MPFTDAAVSIHVAMNVNARNQNSMLNWLVSCGQARRYACSMS